MPIITVYKKLDYSRSTHLNTTTQELYLSWAQTLAHMNLDNNTLVLKNVTTVFAAPDHGFYRGHLEVDFLHNSHTMHSEQLSGAERLLRTIDLRWDGQSRVVSHDCHLNIGHIYRAGNAAQFALHGNRAQSTDTQGLFTDGTLTTAIPRADDSDVGPYSVTLVFEYNPEGLN
jgi:hypothetical protein